MIRVSEVFGPVLQGEGPVFGRPTVFVRTGGCSFRCRWCDSSHAVLPEYRHEWRSMEAGDVLAEVGRLAAAPFLVTLSGGDPCEQPLGELVRLGRLAGYRFGVETQGVHAPSWLAEAAVVVLSPKPPSSGMTVNWRRFDRAVAVSCHGDRGGRIVAVKVPIFDSADLDWFEREVAWRYSVPVYLSVGNPNPPPAAVDIPDILKRWRWLAEEVLRRRLSVTVTPQGHVLLYGNERAR